MSETPKSIVLKHPGTAAQLIPNVHRHAAVQIARARLANPVEEWEAAFTYADHADDAPLIEAELTLIVAEIDRLRAEPTNDIDAVGRCCCAGCVGSGPCDRDPCSEETT